MADNVKPLCVFLARVLLRTKRSSKPEEGAGPGTSTYRDIFNPHKSCQKRCSLSSFTATAFQRSCLLCGCGQCTCSSCGSMWDCCHEMSWNVMKCHEMSNKTEVISNRSAIVADCSTIEGGADAAAAEQAWFGGSRQLKCQRRQIAPKTSNATQTDSLLKHSKAGLQCIVD